MKSFDLEKALAGEPVKLRYGGKAYVKYILDDRYSTSYPLRGFAEYKRLPEGTLHVNELSWHLNGEIASNKDSELDIVGMWEEPKPKRFINGIEVPEPVTEETWVDGDCYWHMSLGTPAAVSEMIFCKDSQIDRLLISRRVVFETKEGAEAMAKALLNYKVEVKNE